MVGDPAIGARIRQRAHQRPPADGIAAPPWPIFPLLPRKCVDADVHAARYFAGVISPVAELMAAYSPPIPFRL
jgi:hypothetical protein